MCHAAMDTPPQAHHRKDLLIDNYLESDLQHEPLKNAVHLFGLSQAVYELTYEEFS